METRSDLPTNDNVNWAQYEFDVSEMMMDCFTRLNSIEHGIKLLRNLTTGKDRTRRLQWGIANAHKNAFIYHDTSNPLRDLCSTRLVRVILFAFIGDESFDITDLRLAKQTRANAVQFKTYWSVDTGDFKDALNYQIKHLTGIEPRFKSVNGRILISY